MRSVLLTGASGFVGRHVAAAFVANGWRVVQVVRRETDAKKLMYGESLCHDGTTEAMIRLVAMVRPDLCIHLASTFVAEHQPSHIQPLIESNVLFGSQVLEGVVRAGVKYFINTGTSWQHYNDSAYSPACLYAATKQAFEDVLVYYVEAHGLRAYTLELFDTYGPGDERPKLFHALALAAKGERMLFSPGAQLLDLVHIDDVAAAYLRAADHICSNEGSVHERYVVSSGRTASLREIAAIYERVKGVSLNIDWGARPYRKREVMSPWSGGVQVPGWVAQHTLEAGIAELPNPCHEVPH